MKELLTFTFSFSESHCLVKKMPIMVWGLELDLAFVEEGIRVCVQFDHRIMRTSTALISILIRVKVF